MRWKVTKVPTGNTNRLLKGFLSCDDGSIKVLDDVQSDGRFAVGSVIVVHVVKRWT